MSRPGSLDDIQDAIDILDRSGCLYLLFVGRLGEKCSRLWSKNRGCTTPDDVAKVKEAIDEHIHGYWPLPDEDD